MQITGSVDVHGFWVTPRSWEHWIAHCAQFETRPSARAEALAD